MLFMVTFVDEMNLKLNNEDAPTVAQVEPVSLSSSEERRRTGKFVAILVGISLICLAMYHAWVRRLPVIASIIVPALIMLLYVLWVLYTASKDRKSKGARVMEANNSEVVTAENIPEMQYNNQEVTSSKETTIEIDPPALCPKIEVLTSEDYPWKRSFSIA